MKLSINAVADRYGVSAKTIRRYVASGRLKACRVGPKLIRIDADEAERQLGEPVTRIAI